MVAGPSQTRGSHRAGHDHASDRRHGPGSRMFGSERLEWGTGACALQRCAELLPRSIIVTRQVRFGSSDFDQMKLCGYAPRSKARTMHMAAPTASASMPSSQAITRLVWTACARPQRALPACVPAGSSATRIRGIAIGRRPSRETPAVGAGSSRETNALRATGSSVTSRTLSKKAWLWAGLTISGSKMPERTYGRTRVHIPVV